MTISCWSDKAIVFFSCDTCHRLEPMCEVCSAFFKCPIFHCICNDVCHFSIQSFALLHNTTHHFICIFRQSLFHYTFIEHHRAEQFWNIFNHYRYLLILCNTTLFTYTKKGYPHVIPINQLLGCPKTDEWKFSQPLCCLQRNYRSILCNMSICFFQKKSNVLLRRTHL